VRGKAYKLGEGCQKVRSGYLAKYSHFRSSGNSRKLRTLFYPHPDILVILLTLDLNMKKFYMIGSLSLLFLSLENVDQLHIAVAL